MGDLLTKPDLQVALQAAITPLERRMDKLETNMGKLEVSIENLSMRLTLRLGAMLVVAIGALATLLRLA
ncbi:MAG TPA: hypothetical protein VK456_17710 [Xanthobacteraceae bacterium]|nr:hypothetical protein [Xanthobacteraceae bacterium]